MSKKNKEKIEENLEIVEGALTRTERYIEQNQKSLTIIILAIVAIIGGYLAYQKFYVQGLEKKAQAEMFAAERYFELDSFNLALNGDGINQGVLYIIDEYGVTKSANLSHYYAGISYLHLGNFEKAIEYLKGFDSKDVILSALATGAIGDAYVELGDLDEALSFYLKATKINANEFTTPLFLKKAALIHEEKGDFKGALELYTKIKKEYHTSREANDIDKYITRAELKAGA